MRRHVRHIALLFTITGLASLAISCSPRFARDGYGARYGSEKRRELVRTANRYRGAPYRYGGNTPRGFDCSGFVGYVYERNGISLPRTAGEQYHEGRRIPQERLRPGDLVFFQTSRERISHVGIYTGNDRFIHAPRQGKRVGYASLSNPYWHRRYRGAVSYLRN